METKETIKVANALKFKMHKLTISLGDHASDEVLIPDLAIGSNIYLTDPLIELRRLQFLPNTSQNMSEIRNDDVAGPILVQNLERVTELAVKRLRL